MLLGDAGTLVVEKDLVRVDWNNQASLILHNDSSSDFANIFSSIEVGLPEKYKNRVEGLLGTYDGDPTNDFQIRNGKTLSDPTEKELYSSGFRDSWSIYHNASASLFTQETNPYRADYPSKQNPGFSVADFLEARKVCTEFGIDLPSVILPCALDVLITGNEDWASVHKKIDPALPELLISPAVLEAFTGESINISASIRNLEDVDLQWQASAGGLVVSNETSLLVNYTAPSDAGEYFVTVSSISSPTLSSTAKVIVSEPFETLNPIGD